MIKHEHSKIIGMRRDEKGMASIVIVSILAVLITLISLGFARLMQRATINSENRQAANAATYAAESALNDVANYIKTNPQVNSPQCDSLIGNSSSPGPFYNDSNLASGAQYNCILLNQDPANVAYQNIPSNSSRVIKATTSAWPGSLDKMMISWQPSNNPTITGLTTTTTFKDTTTWNSTATSGASVSGCRTLSSATNVPCIPMLRVTLYPIPVAPGGGSPDISDLQANTKTFFLYPDLGSASADVTSLNFSTTKDGTTNQVNCDTTKVPNTTYFNGTADYTCNIIFTNLTSAIPGQQTDYFYVRVMPLYSAADVQLKANDQWDQIIKFIHTQAIVDVTATSDSVSKRLQARVDISSVGNGGQPSDNISPTDYSIPEYALRTSNALCKQWQLYAQDNITYYYSFVQLDPNAPQEICDPNGSTINIPAPQLTMNIVGNDGQDNGLTVDSQANNPDTPQAPQEVGTVYVNSAATVNYVSQDAPFKCIASGGWSGNVYTQNPKPTWSGSTATGARSFTSITNVTNYGLTCYGLEGTQVSKQVTLWPPPKITSLSAQATDGGAVTAGKDYTVSWGSKNDQPDSYKPCTLSGDWGGADKSSGSRQFHWDWTDTSTKTFKVTCRDPVGRTGTATISVTPQPPSCSAQVLPYPSNYPNFDHGDGTGGWQWIGGCVGVPSSSTWGQVTCTGPGIQCSNTLSGNQAGLSTGSYSAEMKVGMYGSYWPNDTADSGLKTWTIHVPVTGLSLSSPDGLWDESPRCDSPGNWWDGTWWCWRDGHHTTTSPGGGYYSGQRLCADGAHQWTMCDIKWSSSAGSETSNITCSISTSYGGFLSGLSASGSRTGPGPTGGWGWGHTDTPDYGGDGPTPNQFKLSCSTPWHSASQSFTIP